MGNFASNALVSTVRTSEILTKPYLEHQWFCIHAACMVE